MIWTPVRTMARAALIVALGVAGFLVGVGPANADNGPHVAGAGVLSDSCAGCHRIHTGKSEALTVEPQPALCYTCHDATGTGATTDVIDGVSKAAGGGALRGGGFQYALISGVATGQTENFKNEVSGQVLPLDSSLAGTPAVATTSSHSVDGTSAMAFGNGDIAPTVSLGNTVQLRCGSCHDPHGNGNYRTLRAIPLQSGAPGSGISIAEPVSTAKSYTTGNYWPTKTDESAINFIGSVSAWCATCHTRYYAGTDTTGGVDSETTNSTDPVFAFRHRSASKAAGRPTCIQCHVAHGSNVAVTPPAAIPHPPNSLAANVAHPDERTGKMLVDPSLPANDSKLLRITDQGTCTMCHTTADVTP